MTEEKVLTKEIAEQFLADAKSVELSLFTTIEDAAAEILTKEKTCLGLDGLTKISPIAAKYLANSEAGEFGLNGLTTLEEGVAAALSNYKGNLYLEGLIEISDKDAESLSNRREFVSFYALKTISEPAARSLAKLWNTGSFQASSDIEEKISEYVDHTNEDTKGPPMEWGPVG